MNKEFSALQEEKIRQIVRDEVAKIYLKNIQERLINKIDEKIISPQLYLKLVKELQTENSFQGESPC